MAEHNGVMMQYFHWYSPSDGSLWNQLKKQASELSESGITAVWLPPAYKGSGGENDVGYGIYDLFDLGEFDQMGSVRTKYGTKEEYLNAIKAAHNVDIQVYADVVFNHKLGADEVEELNATPYNPQNRNEAIGDLQNIKSWTRFNFPGRDGKYSNFVWNWNHFTASDYNEFKPDENSIYLFEGKKFDDEVDQELGNFDYLMGCDIDVTNEEVKNELINWGKWYSDTTQIDGFRFDAVKHIKSDFFYEWIYHMQEHAKKEFFSVGEYWSNHPKALEYFLEVTNRCMMLFDTGLHYNFATASNQRSEYNLQTLFNDTLVEKYPELAVTLVSNHDTQPLQSLESVVEAWFKPIAYAVILLRKFGYPCLFSADYYGAEYKDYGKDGNEYEITMASHKWLIDKFLYVRKLFAFGEEISYLDHPNCIGWIRNGGDHKAGGIAVVISNGGDGIKRMEIGYPNCEYYDITEHITEMLTTDEEGFGEFRCNAESVSVWIKKVK